MGDEIEKLHQQIDKLTVGDKKEWGLLDDDDGPIPPPNFDDDAKTKKGDSAGASKGDGAGAAASATSGGGSGGGAASSTTTGGGGDKSASSDKLSKDEYGAVGTELERTVFTHSHALGSAARVTARICCDTALTVRRWHRY